MTRRIRRAGQAIRGQYDPATLELEARRLFKLAEDASEPAGSVGDVLPLSDAASAWAQALAARTHTPHSPAALEDALLGIVERIVRSSPRELAQVAREAGAELGERLRVMPAAFEDLLQVLIPWIEHHHRGRDDDGHPVRAKVLAALAAGYAQAVVERLLDGQLSNTKNVGAMREQRAHAMVASDPYTFTQSMETCADVPMMVLDRRGVVLGANGAAKALLALGDDQGCYLEDTGYTAADSITVKDIIESLSPAVPLHVDYAVAWPEGTFKAWVRLTLQWHPGNAHNPGRVCAVFEDATNHHVWRRHLDQLANRDEVTNLPSRRAFLASVQNLLDSTSVRDDLADRTVGICVIRLVGLTRITRELGLHLSDLVIKTLAARTAAALAGLPDTITARLDRDTLAVMIGDRQSWAAAADTIKRLSAWLSEPVPARKHRFAITPRVGVAEANTRGLTAGDLLARAESALDNETTTTRRPWTIIDNGSDGQARTSLIAALPDALAHDELALTYSPIVRVDDTAIAGLRIHIRWNHPDYGDIAADRVVGAADELGMDLPLARWALNTATRDALSASGLPPHLLHLALPAEAFLGDDNRTRPHIEALEGMGTSLELRGFGTRFAAFGHLTAIPLTGVIIPRPLTTHLHNSPEHRGIRGVAHSLMGITADLGYTVQLDGITTPDQIHDARLHTVCHAHGPLFGTALPAEDITTLLDEEPAGHTWITAHGRVPLQRR
ncbi:EAL domain-containing protein [Actinokineospora sp. 24-640]